MGTDAIGFSLVILTVGMSMIAARSRQVLLAIGASALWASLMAFILTNTTAGLNWQVIFVISAIAFMIAMLLLGVFSRYTAPTGYYEPTEETPMTKTMKGIASQFGATKSTQGAKLNDTPEQHQLNIRRALNKGRRRRR